MTEAARQPLNDTSRARLIGGAGLLIILLSAGAALLPTVEKANGGTLVGALLLASGVIEMVAGYFRRAVRYLAIGAGALTAAAGLLFLLSPSGRFLPLVSIVTAWLLARSIVLLITSRRARGSVRMWLSLAAGMDFLLAFTLFTGLSIATIVVLLFGPTGPLIASFSWVLALSFVVTGSMLLEIASCERQVAEG